jgi:bifunctional UDP-N-acetylglucosamine pyrophosphorylase / glucosamine-1-phosphate N-acetyltransferase
MAVKETVHGEVEEMEQLAAVILAAGEGKRMKSDLPKVLHSLCGKPMLEYIIESAAELTNRVVIVVGYGASLVKETIGSRWQYVLQDKQLGTGHAVMQAVPVLPAEGLLLVLCGDTPLLDVQTLQKLIDTGRTKVVTVATTFVPDPRGYGRIVRDNEGNVKAIVEEKDAGEEEKMIREINSGTYCFDLRYLRHYLPRLSTNNAQGEYYLTDLVAMIAEDGHAVGAYVIDDYRKGLGINDQNQLAEAEHLLCNDRNSG